MSFSPYMKDSYKKTFETKVKSVQEGKFVVLEETYFYPASGGQPYDTGTITTKEGKEVKVIYVGKFGGNISHEVEPTNILKEGEAVTGTINWERRYKLMRMHTAAHIISHLFETKKGAVITGNQLGEEKSRIDYQLDDYNPEEMKSYEPLANELVEQALTIQNHFLSREEADKKLERMSSLKMGLPKEVKEVRVLEIGDVDAQACGGTHLKNTSEIGHIKFLKFDNKGKNNRRVYYTVE